MPVEQFNLSNFFINHSKMYNTKRLIIAVICLYSSCFVIESDAAVPNLCKDITSKSMELQLKTHLFCDYDPDVRPVIDPKNVTNVGLAIMPKIIEFVGV